VELLAVVLGAYDASRRDWCIRQAGEPGAETTLAERWLGAQRLAAQEPPAEAAAGTSSCIRQALFWQAPLRAEDLTVWMVQALGRPVFPLATYNLESSVLARQALSWRQAEMQPVGMGFPYRGSAPPPPDHCHF
jgi:hypothetical protein